MGVFSWRRPDSVNHVINIDQLEYPDLSTTTVKVIVITHIKLFFFCMSVLSLSIS